ncbi:MAG: Asp23/Gls24 family envelope stress response protein [Synergistaceae bacterium]|nr:Asp23/Gls24 family envelope stress response protein [Synergistaceae bacterium]
MTEKTADNVAMEENVNASGDGVTINQSKFDGKVRISEDVIAQLATKALSSVEGVSPASPGLMANLRLGRKTVNGVRISISEGEATEIVIDAYVSIKYGMRIPDVCWDVQEAIKEQVERFTGYVIKSVNVFVQGVTFADKKSADAEQAVEESEDILDGQI